MSEIRSNLDATSAVTEDNALHSQISNNSLSKLHIYADDHIEEANSTSAIPAISDNFAVNGKKIQLHNMNAGVGASQSQRGEYSQNGVMETTKLCESDSDVNCNDEVSMALQLNLERQMNAKAEAENKVRLLASTIHTFEEQLFKQQEEISKNETLHENLRLQMTAKAEAENKARSAFDRMQQLESEIEMNRHDLTLAHELIVELREAVAEKERELNKVRSDRDEYERKVDGLTTRLNAARKKDAVKVNHLDEVVNDLEVALQDLEQTKSELQKSLTINALLEQKLQYCEMSSNERIDHLEKALKDEQHLNEERKIKMKDYVEKKAEELRQVKEENNSLQIDLTQTNHSLVELNNRWKQLHVQWVRAQTWNRELQRDLLRMKKDSEHLHKQGDTLEMKLSRSANETEEHKNKRLAAKQELLSVLRALENERDTTANLCDKIKFSFIPKLLNQQQALKELLEELVASLEKLSIRLGKPVPTPSSELTDGDDVGYDKNNGLHHKNVIPAIGEVSIHSDANPLIEKLETESQNLSDVISSVAVNVDRLHMLVHASGDRTCFTILSDLVSAGTRVRSPALQVERHSLSNPLAAIGLSHRYGQVPGNTDNL
jgi:chromosome segregation ATPase